MKSLILPILLSGSFPAFAADSGDTHCQVYIENAGNEMTEEGNFLFAKVMVAKSLLKPSSVVKIQDHEDSLPSKIQDKGDFVEYDFDRYAPGIRYHGSSPSILAYLDDGTDRIFDNNYNVLLVAQYGWQFTTPCCPLR